MATAERLRERLIQTLSMDAYSGVEKYTLRDAIQTSRVHGAVCARDPAVGGRVMTFEAYFQAVFGEGTDGKIVKVKK